MKQKKAKKTKSKKKTKKKVTKNYRTKKHFKTRNDDKCDAQHNSTTKRNKPSCNEALGISNSDKRFEPIWGASGWINYYTDIGAGGQRQVLHVQGRSHNIHCSTFNFYRSDDLLRTTPSPAPAPKGNRLC